ncbi:hypothetical protein PPACK8108_LOCUS9818, partial [Phakopsora pachyrhizi]
MSRMFRPIIYYYDRSFRSHPGLTLAIANAFCSIIGDTAAQLIPTLTSDPSQKLSFDFFRLLRYFLYGLNMGPISGKWNEFLEWTFPQKPKSRTNSIKEKSIELIEIGTSANDQSTNQSLSDGSDHHPSHPKLLTILKMVATDQLVMAPISLIIFLGFMGFTEGLRLEEIYERIDRLFYKLLIANWKCWPIIQLINFRFMPLKLRVPFGACCGIVWTIFLSYAS